MKNSTEPTSECIFLDPLVGAAFTSNHSCERKADWIVTDSQGREFESCLKHAEDYRLLAGYKVRRMGETQLAADIRSANERWTVIKAMRAMGIEDERIMAHVNKFYPDLAVRS